MSERGYFLVDRAFWDRPSLADRRPFTKGYAWHWLLSEAAYKGRHYDVGGRVIELQRGQLAHSIRYLAKRWRWSINTVRLFLDILRDDTLIDTATDTGVTIITICDYDKIQNGASATDTATDTVTDTPTDTEKKQGNQGKQYKLAKASLLGATSRATRAKQLPPDWKLSEADRAYAASQGLSGEETGEEAENFKSYHRAKGTRMVDWAAAWQNWVRKAIKFKKENRDAQANRRTKPPLGARARELAAEIRERERALGIGRPDDLVGSG